MKTKKKIRKQRMQREKKYRNREQRLSHNEIVRIESEDKRMIYQNCL